MPKFTLLGIMLISLVTSLITFQVFAQQSANEASDDSGKTVIATYAGKQLTLSEADEVFSLRAPREHRFFMGRPLNDIDPDNARAIVRSLVAQELLADKAKKEGFTLTQEWKERLLTLQNRQLVNRFVREEILEKVSPATEEEARKFYEENIKRYTQPFEFEIKQILMLTYKEYETKEGDTLEKIAEEISKDPEAIKDIREVSTFKPRWVAPEDREKVLFRPLGANEQLLVPMSKEGKQQVFNQMKTIHKELKAGADFDAMVEKYSRVTQTSKVTPERMVNTPHPELVETAQKTAVGDFSDVVETKVGYRILKVIDKTEERAVPFDDVKDQILGILTREKQTEHAENMFHEMIKTSSLVKTYPEVLADDKASTDAIVAQIGDTKITKQMFLARLSRYIDDSMSPEQKFAEMARLPEFAAYVLPAEAHKKGLDKHKEYNKAREHIEIQMFAEAYLQDLYDNKVKPTDEDLKKFYNENLDDYTIPPQYKIRQIVRKIHDDLNNLEPAQKEKVLKAKMDEMKEIRAKINSIEDFANVAEEFSEDDPTRKKGGELGYVPATYRQGFEGRLEKMSVGEISEPFQYGIFAYILLVEDIKGSEIQSFEEVRERVERVWLFQNQKQVRDDLYDELLKAADFKYLADVKSDAVSQQQ